MSKSKKVETRAFIDALLSTSGTPAPTGALTPDVATDDALRGLPSPVIRWLQGHLPEEPPEVSKMMDTVAKKMNISLAQLIVNRLVSLNRIIRFMSRVEDDTFENEEYAKMDAATRFSVYQHFDKTLSDFMDFVRKFVSQNADQFNNSQPADELAVLLRTVDPMVLKKLVSVLRSKGAAITENDFRELGVDISKPGIELVE